MRQNYGGIEITLDLLAARDFATGAQEDGVTIGTLFSP